MKVSNAWKEIFRRNLLSMEGKNNTLYHAYDVQATFPAIWLLTCGLSSGSTPNSYLE